MNFAFLVVAALGVNVVPKLKATKPLENQDMYSRNTRNGCFQDRYWVSRTVYESDSDDIYWSDSDDAANSGREDPHASSNYLVDARQRLKKVAPQANATKPLVTVVPQGAANSDFPASVRERPLKVAPKFKATLPKVMPRSCVYKDPAANSDVPVPVHQGPLVSKLDAFVTADVITQKLRDHLRSESVGILPEEMYRINRERTNRHQEQVTPQEKKDMKRGIEQAALKEIIAIESVGSKNKRFDAKRWAITEEAFKQYCREHQSGTFAHFDDLNLFQVSDHLDNELGQHALKMENAWKSSGKNFAHTLQERHALMSEMWDRRSNLKDIRHLTGADPVNDKLRADPVNDKLQISGAAAQVSGGVCAAGRALLKVGQGAKALFKKTKEPPSTRSNIHHRNIYHGYPGGCTDE